MTAKAFIKQAELNRLAAVAKRHGITIEIETEQYKLRMYSTDPTDEGATTPEPNPWDIALNQHPPEPIQPPLDHREAKAMNFLMEIGAEKPIDWYRLKNFGRHSQQKLENRGYIEVSNNSDRTGNPDQIWLTKSGQAAMLALKAHRLSYPVL